jgi:NADH:ubiquinone oxidoreductase subunit 3 (subunit A)
MKNVILSPLVAFLLYLVVVFIVSGLGKLFSAKGHNAEFKTATYASGEESDPLPAAPGYRQFFVVALFFAILHLGVLMIGSSGLSAVAVPYLLGLILVLIALILG